MQPTCCLEEKAEALCKELGVPLYVPPPELCTDNGAMIAAAGFSNTSA